MRALPLLFALVFSAPSLAGLGGLLKAVSKVDDVGKAAGKTATHTDDVGAAARAGANGENARVLDDGAKTGDEAAHADDGEGIGQKVGEAAIDVAGAAGGDDDGDKRAPVDLRSAERAKHQSRMAKIKALESVYGETGDVALLEKIMRIRGKELARHAKRMQQLGGKK